MGEFVVALVGAAGTIIGSLIGSRRGRNNERQSLEKQARENALSLQDALGARIGLTAVSATSHMNVQENGDAFVRRWWRGIKVTEGHTISYVSGMFWTVTPGSTLGQVRLENVADYPKPITLEIDPVGDTGCRWKSMIASPLTHDDPPLDLTLNAEFQRGVLMSENAVRQAYGDDPFNHDYFLIEIDLPVDAIEVSIHFAEGTRPHKLFPVVFWGNSEYEHFSELHRTQAGFELTPDGAKYAVTEPLFGFRYAISWCFDRASHGVGLMPKDRHVPDDKDGGREMVKTGSN